jgi:hypothetical protein
MASIQTLSPGDVSLQGLRSMFQRFPASTRFTVHELGEKLKALGSTGMKEEDALKCLAQAPFLFSWDLKRACLLACLHLSLTMLKKASLAAAETRYH